MWGTKGDISEEGRGNFRALGKFRLIGLESSMLPGYNQIDVITPKIWECLFPLDTFSGFQGHFWEFYMAVSRQIGLNLFIVTVGNPTEVFDQKNLGGIHPEGQHLRVNLMDPGQYFRHYILAYL